MAVEVRRARPEETRELAITLARAFDDDPFVNWMVRQDRRRRQSIAWSMRYELENLGFPQGEVYTTEGNLGAAIWLPPGAAGPGRLSQLRVLPRLIRAVGMRRLFSRLQGFGAVNAKHPKEPHWYLPTIGVAPGHQGEGIGSALLRPILERCDETGVPAYLESSKDVNVPLYERHGFQVLERFEVPPDGPPLWLMWREPQAVAAAAAEAAVTAPAAGD